MKKNLTVSMEKEVLRKGKVLAARQGTSLSRLVSDRLQEPIREKEAHILARKKALAQIKKGFHGGGKPISREELHER
jgi:hypothetical protein